MTKRLRDIRYVPIGMVAVVLALGLLSGCGQSQAPDRASSGSESEASSPVVEAATDEVPSGTFAVHVGDAVLDAVFADTDAAQELEALLEDGPVLVPLHSYGGFEMVGPLPEPLAAADEQITTEPGDIMLYSGDQITIFYGSNTWDYTPLGRIEGLSPEELAQTFGDDEAEVVLTLR